MEPDQPEFAAWVDARRPTLWRSAWLLTGDHHRADDLVQTALLKVWPRWTRISTAGDPEPYVRRVMRFDHHPRPRRNHPVRAVVYASVNRGVGDGIDPLRTVVAERFGDSRVIDRSTHEPWLVGWRPTRPLRLLDFADSDWVTRVGANAALTSGARGMAPCLWLIADCCLPSPKRPGSSTTSSFDGCLRMSVTPLLRSCRCCTVRRHGNDCASSEPVVTRPRPSGSGIPPSGALDEIWRDRSPPTSARGLWLQRDQRRQL